MEKKELLGELRDMTNSLIISDLKYVRDEDLSAAVLAINENEYSMTEWHDAIIYLTQDNNINEFTNQSEAKEYLCNYYQKK